MSQHTFEELLAIGERADITGWDFSWLQGRATEERPPWGYAHLMAARWAQARAALDLQTGGGEVLSQVGAVPPVAVATESWKPNVVAASRRLHPRGIVVVVASPDSSLPFAPGSFDLVTSRHPARIAWDQIARVLQPGGSYFAQHVGPSSAVELIEHFLGPQPRTGGRDPRREVEAARSAGLDVVDLRTARTRIEIFDVAAVVYLLRKLIWWVPDFSVERYHEHLRTLHEQIQREGPFITHSARHLIEARKT